MLSNKMKDLRFKIDIIGGLIVALGGLLLVIFGPFFAGLWIINAAGMVMVFGFIIFAGSGRIARMFIKD